MKNNLLRALVAFAFCSVAPVVPAQTAAPAYTFPPADLMNIGVYYYPEAWPATQWSRDMANIKQLGMEFVHMGEFSWAFMEPTEGTFDFSWLDKNIELAAARGLKVVLCTPTPAPPVWLTQKYPDSLMVDLLLQTAALRLEAGDAKGAFDAYTQLQQRTIPAEFEPALEGGYIIAGSASTVRDRLKRDNEVAGINYCLCRLAFGDLSFDESARSIELLAKEVMPAL